MLGQSEPKWKKLLYELWAGRNYDTQRHSNLRVGLIAIILFIGLSIRIYLGISSGEYDRRAAQLGSNTTPQTELDLIGPTVISVQANNNDPTTPAVPPTIEPTLVAGITILWEGSPKGIVSEMLCTERVARTGDILFAALRDQPDVTAEPHTPITGRSIIAVVDGKTIGDWYYIRVLYSDIDTANEGKEGYILKWIIDGANYPSCPVQPTLAPANPGQPVQPILAEPTNTPAELQPEPTAEGLEPSIQPSSPTPEVAPTAEQRSFKGFISSQNIDTSVECSTDQFASKVTGIISENGAPYANALILAVSDGGANAQVTSQADGRFEIPGLGCATWTIQVNGQPTEPFTVKVNGLPGTTIDVVL